MRNSVRIDLLLYAWCCLEQAWSLGLVELAGGIPVGRTRNGLLLDVAEWTKRYHT
jgi:hypothetical protein